MKNLIKILLIFSVDMQVYVISILGPKHHTIKAFGGVKI